VPVSKFLFQFRLQSNIQVLASKGCVAEKKTTPVFNPNGLKAAAVLNCLNYKIGAATNAPPLHPC
jgi:hypothetical protein